MKQSNKLPGTNSEIKREYNNTLIRFHKAWEWFEREDVSQEDKEKYLPLFQEVLNGLNFYLSQITVYTQQEVLEGFHNG